MSGTKNLKPLVITTRHEQSAGSEYVWNKLQSPKNFIDGIVTPDIDIQNSDDVSRLISGIPTPFARPAMFKYAMAHIGQPGEQAAAIVAFYRALQDEWKGLVACLALDNQPISVEKIELSYSDGRSPSETSNLYEPKGALGNMLFEDTELWCDPAARADRTRRAVPFIQVIRYNGKVVGGTAPDSLLFTAPMYDIGVKRPFYSETTKKFTDPLRGSPSPEEVEKLYVYVRHIADSIEAFTQQFSGKRPQVKNLERFLESWREQIRVYAREKGYEINENAIVPNLNKFALPFDVVFNFQTTLYGWGGRISSDKLSLHVPEGSLPVEVELAELLLDPATSTVAEILLDDPSDANRMGVHMLKAVTDRGHRYFTLPLSEKGLMIFQDELEALLEATGDIRSRLAGAYDGATNTLRVTLQVDVNGTTTSFEKEFKNPALIEGQRMICWPDFVSPLWNSYYLYSELPHNSADVKAFPLRADRGTFRLITESIDGEDRFAKFVVNGRKAHEADVGGIVVEYDMNKIASTEIKYEIYESGEPFKGAEIKIKDRQAGYVLFRSLTSGNQFGLKDFRHKNTTLDGVRVGFDFGSNNTCISYSEETKNPELITFTNRRRCLLGADVQSNERAAAAPHEVFFFQNEETPSNHVKSMVMLHDEGRIAGFDVDPTIALSGPVRGGLPVFEKNIPVENSVDNRYEVRFAGRPTYIRYNMKWSDEGKENASKAALLKGLWLKTYAELLDKKKYPGKLVWAYPSAMETHRRKDYLELWRDVATINPLAGGTSPFPNAEVAALGDARVRSDGRRASIQTDSVTAQTESFSVCRHALQQMMMQADRYSLVIGFDVGGSTTDIMCLAQKRNPRVPGEEFATTLIKEGSIRLAAGRLADATGKSPKFQQVLKSFCRKKNLFVNGINVPPERLNATTAPYYYNLIVDRLRNPAELAEFYRALASDCPDLFTLNTFMTGLILFYAGQLANRVRLTQAEQPADYQQPFSRVEIGCFGKGGRMFDWLLAMSHDAAMNYYQDCFYAGYGKDADTHIERFSLRPPEPRFVKAEVSFGLSGTHEVLATTEQIAELVGEDGFNYNGEPVGEIDAVESRFFQHFGSQFAPPSELRRFTDFAKLFRDFSKEYFAFNMPTLERDIGEMRLTAYISNLPEYRAAKVAFQANRSDRADAPTSFDFVAPIIILEGMCFLETVLSPKLFGQ